MRGGSNDYHWSQSVCHLVRCRRCYKHMVHTHASFKAGGRWPHAGPPPRTFHRSQELSERLRSLGDPVPDLEQFRTSLEWLDLLNGRNEGRKTDEAARQAWEGGRMEWRVEALRL